MTTSLAISLSIAALFIAILVLLARLAIVAFVRWLFDVKRHACAHKISPAVAYNELVNSPVTVSIRDSKSATNDPSSVVIYHPVYDFIKRRIRIYALYATSGKTTDDYAAREVTSIPLNRDVLYRFRNAIGTAEANISKVLDTCVSTKEPRALRESANDTVASETIRTNVRVIVRSPTQIEYVDARNAAARLILTLPRGFRVEPVPGSTLELTVSRYGPCSDDGTSEAYAKGGFERTPVRYEDYLNFYAFRLISGKKAQDDSSERVLDYLAWWCRTIDDPRPDLVPAS